MYKSGYPGVGRVQASLFVRVRRACSRSAFWSPQQRLAPRSLRSCRRMRGLRGSPPGQASTTSEKIKSWNSDPRHNGLNADQPAERGERSRDHRSGQEKAKPGQSRPAHQPGAFTRPASSTWRPCILTQRLTRDLVSLKVSSLLWDGSPWTPRPLVPESGL
jgi:hypothetical protein